jgi:hypothetical protein
MTLCESDYEITTAQSHFCSERARGDMDSAGILHSIIVCVEMPGNTWNTSRLSNHTELSEFKTRVKECTYTA